MKLLEDDSVNEVKENYGVATSRDSNRSTVQQARRCLILNTIRYVIPQLFSVCEVYLLHPAQTSYSSSSTASCDRPKQTKRYPVYLQYLAYLAASFAVSLPNDANPTYIYIYI